MWNEQRNDYMTDAELMRMAIKKAREGVAAGQSPFGACIARDGEVIACEHNEVWQTTDSTAHAEIVTIRAACRTLGSIDLSGCTIYSTTEPCPMCFSACHWARISRIVFGTRIDDARRFGFNELGILNVDMKRLGSSPILIECDFLREEAVALFETWAARSGHRPY
jgi:guanine deaminase